jgi:hypothetical protein
MSRACPSELDTIDPFHLQAFLADVFVDLGLAYPVDFVEKWQWNQNREGNILAYVFCHIQKKLVGIGSSYEEVETFQTGSYGVADWIRRGAPSLNDANESSRTCPFRR